MPEASSGPLAVYRYLPGTNCGRCQLPTCLAFAAALLSGTKTIPDCPVMPEDSRARLQGLLPGRQHREPEQALFFDRLEEKIRQVNFARIASVIGAKHENGQLVISSLGKDFHVDQAGQVRSECHIIPWVRAPLLSYITNRTHEDITGTWITFRELRGGIDWQELFTSRCERPLRLIADSHPDLFSDIIDLFMGKQLAGFQADIAFVLHPLPHFPILITYQGAEEELGSELKIFFDACCATNLHIKSTYTLCAGLVTMFARIAEMHS